MPRHPNQMAALFVALWPETDPESRRRLVDELYAEDATYVFYRRPPLHGRQRILDQIIYTQELYRPMGYVFKSSHNAIGHHDVMRWNWVMVTRDGGDLEMAGQDMVILAEDGRIQTDYQSHDRTPASFAYNDGFEEHGVATRPARPTLVRERTVG